MEKVTLREYSKRKKLSYFTVMKLVRNGEVESETVVEEGKDVSYILLDDEAKKDTQKKRVNITPQTVTLQEENMLLKEEIVKLKEALERCNRRTVLS